MLSCANCFVQICQLAETTMLAIHRPVSVQLSGAALVPFVEQTRAQGASHKLRRPTQCKLAECHSTRSDLRSTHRHLPRDCTHRITEQDAAEATCLQYVPKQPTAIVQRRHLLQHVLLAATASALSSVGERAQMPAAMAKCPCNLQFCCFAAQPAQADLIRDLVKGYVRPVSL